MKNEDKPLVFLSEVVDVINSKDKLHSKKIKANLDYINKKFQVQFEELLFLVYSYFNDRNLYAATIADDYLKMISDMRREGLFFYKHNKYRCENQNIAYEQVYSKADIMSYYMNALLISQILWKHHFNIFMYFQNNIKRLFKDNGDFSILDVGPGHGFFSFLVKKEFPEYKKIDIIDISETSLKMTQTIIGYDQDKINYYLNDIFEYEDSNSYDFIVLGEVLEHLDDPMGILVKLSKLLKKDGLLWITTPTNSPAIDHVYLFKTKEEVNKLISDSGLVTVDSCNFFAEDVTEEIALKNRVTNLVGLFCRNEL